MTAARGRVLLVEDDADLAWVERFNLESEGYEVRVAAEGRDALRQIESFAPQVMVLDVMLPHVSGWTVLARAQELPPEQRPRAILVSAVASLSDRARAREMGVGAFLAKPFEMEELLKLVGDAFQTA